jgi:hypothetical protein
MADKDDEITQKSDPNIEPNRAVNERTARSVGVLRDTSRTT